MPDRVLIWGAGAIGGTVGAFLVRAGNDITFVDFEAGHVAAISDPDRGLAITAQGVDYPKCCKLTEMTHEIGDGKQSMTDDHPLEFRPA